MAGQDIRLGALNGTSQLLAVRFPTEQGPTPLFIFDGITTRRPGAARSRHRIPARIVGRRRLYRQRTEWNG